MTSSSGVNPLCGNSANAEIRGALAPSRPRRVPRADARNKIVWRASFTLAAKPLYSPPGLSARPERGKGEAAAFPHAPPSFLAEGRCAP